MTVTYTWSGSTSSDWNTSANWTPNGVPNSADASVIDNLPSVSADISGGVTDTVGNLLVNTGTGTIGVIAGGNTITGGSGSGTLDVLGTITVQSGFVGGIAGSTIEASVLTVDDPASLIAGGTFDVPSIINNNLIEADGGAFGAGAMVLTGGTITGSGVLEVDSDSGPSTLELNDVTTQTVDVESSANNAGALLLDDPSHFGGGLDLRDPNTTLDVFFKGLTGITGAVYSNGTLDIMAGSSVVHSMPFSSVTPVVFSGGNSTMTGYGEIAISPVCYVRGTRIAGERAIEDIQPDDLVLVAGGRERRVIWVGRRSINCTRQPDPTKVWPVRIMAGAFGPGTPRRDLLLSPQHAIFAAGVLIPIKHLINGSTVMQLMPNSVTYFHIELERHDLLLAEGLPAESYLDTGNRAMFENGGGALVLHPDFSRWAWDGRACAELKVAGPEIAAIRRKLARRAAAVLLSRPYKPRISNGASDTQRPIA